MSTSDEIQSRCRSVLEDAWVSDPGYTCPNPHQYPWQWLWDSCFHAIAWSRLGDRRALAELESLFRGQLASGFMPNELYHTRRRARWWQWFTFDHSTITQPPMYGHALRVLQQRGYDVDHLLSGATLAMHHLINSRLDAATGLVKVVHPWETGCDDSPRWSRWQLRGYNRTRWNVTKYALIRAMQVRHGEAIGSRLFEVCPASFNALVAFNAFELAILTADSALQAKARSIVTSLEATWQPSSRTWADLRPGSGAVVSDVPTQEAFLPMLVVNDPAQLSAAWAHLSDPDCFALPFGFAGVSRKRPSYRADGYWRGGSWPQVCYLLMLAANRLGRNESEFVRRRTLNGILASRLSEFVNPETGSPCGATPQSWSAIAVEMLDS